MLNISSDRTALIPYLTAGFPTQADTLDVMRAYARAGADIIELGVPFSDPVADGPTIQRSSQIALEQGTTLEWTLEQLRAFRSEFDTDVVIFTYLNPVLNYGTDSFIADAVRAGANGVLLTDLPLGGDEELEQKITDSALSLIRLIAPTTEPQRALDIARHAEGFIYCVARMGVTGARADLPVDLAEQVQALRSVTDVPVCVGFGISTPEQAASVGKVADGVVVGSALVDLLAREGVDASARLLSAMRDSLDRG